MLTNNNDSVNNYPKNFKHENCPVCGQLDSRCRPSHNDSILCWNTSAYALDEDVWYLIRDVESGASGMRGVMVAPKRGQDYEPIDPQILEYQREQARQQRSLELAKLPSLDARDKGYREIFKGATLSLNHRFLLANKRGLSQQQIDLSIKLNWFITWQKGIACSQNIAGIDPATGETRWLGGMFISAIDESGRILGGQIAADNVEVVGKYFWVSSIKVGGYGCQLPHSGSMPLFIRKHPDSTKTSEIWLVEGGLKSALTALKAWETDKNVVVVGTAMSARFSEQLGEVIALFKPEKIRIMPDAGTTENLSILSGVIQTLEFIRHHGYAPRIGWWGQITKTADSQDIDDYLIANNGDFSGIEWLTLSQFLSIVPPALLSTIAKKNETASTTDSQVDEIVSNIESGKELPDFINNIAHKSYKKYSEWTSPDTAIAGNIITHQPKLATDWKHPEKTEKGWENYPPRQGEILFIKAGTGQGKSHLVSLWMNEYYSESGCIFLGYRNGLLRQQCKKVNGLEHLRGADSDGFLRLLDPYYRVAFCDASLHNMRGSYAYKKILVIDEVMSVISSLLLGSTCSRQRRFRLNVFVDMLRESEMIVCLDAHIENWCVELLTQLSQKTSRKMENVWKDEPRRVKMYLGTDTNPSDKNAIRSEIVEDAKTKPIAVFSDSQHELETLHELLIKEGKDPNSIARVDSKTSGEEWCIKLLEDIDHYMETHPEITTLLVSPSGDSGLDISSAYFKKVFLILCGTLTINSALQMYGRVRDRKVPRTIYCIKDAKLRIDGGFTKGAIQSGMHLSIEHQLRLITDGVDNKEELKDLLFRAVAEWQEKERADKFSEVVSILLAKANFEKLYYRELFVDRLEKMGDVITMVTDDGDIETKKDFQTTSLDVKYAEASKLVAAPVITELEAESYRRKELNPEQLMALKKFDFSHRLPGVEIDQVLAKTLLYDRSYLTGLEQRYYLTNPDVSKEMARLKWGNTLSFSGYFTADLRSRLALKTDCLIKLGLIEFLDDRDWLENGKEVKLLRQRWDELKKEYGADLPNIIGFDWDKKKPILTVYKLLALVGCDLRIVKPTSKQKKSAPKLRRITYGSLHDPTRLAILASFDARFEGLKKVDWQEVRTVCENVIYQSEQATAPV